MRAEKVKEEVVKEVSITMSLKEAQVMRCIMGGTTGNNNLACYNSSFRTVEGVSDQEVMDIGYRFFDVLDTELNG